MASQLCFSIELYSSEVIQLYSNSCASALRFHIIACAIMIHYTIVGSKHRWDQLIVNNPRQIVCDIANVLENFIPPPRIRQANLLRNIHFGEFGHVFTCMLATGLHTKIKSKLP